MRCTYAYPGDVFREDFVKRGQTKLARDMRLDKRREEHAIVVEGHCGLCWIQ